jgi:hypothetical protein
MAARETPLWIPFPDKHHFPLADLQGANASSLRGDFSPSLLSS